MVLRASQREQTSNLGDIIHRSKLIKMKDEWARPDSNWGTSPSQGDIIAGLDHGPMKSLDKETY
jgi:hypothetical protein